MAKIVIDHAYMVQWIVNFAKDDAFIGRYKEFLDYELSEDDTELEFLTLGITINYDEFLPTVQEFYFTNNKKPIINIKNILLRELRRCLVNVLQKNHIREVCGICFKHMDTYGINNYHKDCS